MVLLVVEISSIEKRQWKVGIPVTAEVVRSIGMSQEEVFCIAARLRQVEGVTALVNWS